MVRKRWIPWMLLVSCMGASFLQGCRMFGPVDRASITFTHVPRSGQGGSEVLEQIGGTVMGAKSGDRIVIYSHNQVWWVQPLHSKPFTSITADGSWNTVTHLGYDYAALLVEPGYEPPSRIETLPSVGNGIRAVMSIPGIVAPPIVPKMIHFSGYDWFVRDSPGDHGGEMTEYEPSNVWVDEKGALHLLMSQVEGRWRSAEVRLSRSLGYGTYRFVVQDVGHLPPSAVLALFTRDDRQERDARIEMDVELSKWGHADNRNADYVVQPYYIPENTVRFTVPSGRLINLLRWEPGKASFRTLVGTPSGSDGKQVMSHVFTSGVPIPADERVHLELYDFFHSQSGLQHPVEVVIQKFEYLP